MILRSGDRYYFGASFTGSNYDISFAETVTLCLRAPRPLKDRSLRERVSVCLRECGLVGSVLGAEYGPSRLYNGKLCKCLYVELLITAFDDCIRVPACTGMVVLESSPSGMIVVPSDCCAE